MMKSSADKRREKDKEQIDCEDAEEKKTFHWVEGSIFQKGDDERKDKNESNRITDYHNLGE